MNLTPREKDKLLIAMAAMVARRRLERGVKLNHPEAVALITDFVVEGARDGRSVAELMEAGAHVVSADQVMDGIASMIHDIQVEATFPTARSSSPSTIRSAARTTSRSPAKCWPSRARSSMNVGPRDADAGGVQFRRSADPGRLALSFLRDQSGAQVRPKEGEGLPARHRGRHRGPLRARPEPIRAPRRHRRKTRGLRLPPGGDGQGVITY